MCFEKRSHLNCVEQHVNDAERDINFKGSSQVMEAEGAVVMWKRSIAKHKIRYKRMVSDGDSRAFNSH